MGVHRCSKLLGTVFSLTKRKHSVLVRTSPAPETEGVRSSSIARFIMPSGKKCSVGACTNYAGKTKGVRFHQFPREPNLCKAWVERMGRGNWEPGTWSVVCSDHFAIQDYEDNLCMMQRMGFSRKKHYLKPDAVPTLFALGSQVRSLRKGCLLFLLLCSLVMLYFRVYVTELSFETAISALPHTDAVDNEAHG